MGEVFNHTCSVFEPGIWSHFCWRGKDTSSAERHIHHELSLRLPSSGLYPADSYKYLSENDCFWWFTETKLTWLYRLTTPIMPSLTGMTLPISTSIASVPASIKSSFVTTANVLLPKNKQNRCKIMKNLNTTKMFKYKWDGLPSGSTSRATFKASDVAMSVFAAVTANIIEFGFEMYLKIKSFIWNSMSLGWSPTGTYGTTDCRLDKCLNERDKM